MSSLSVRSVAELLRQAPDFRRAWFAEMTSDLGDWLSYIAIAVLATKSESGAMAVGLLFAAHNMPRAIAMPFTGWAADRFSRKNLMVGANIARCLVTIVMAWAAFEANVWLLELLLIVRMLASAVFEPANDAALPQLVGDKALIGTANTLKAFAWSVMFSGGSALGGLLVGLFGPTLVVGLDAITFLIAIVLLLGLPRLDPPESVQGLTNQSFVPSVLGFPRDLAAGLRAAVSTPKLVFGVFGKAPLLIPNAAGWVFLNLVVEEDETLLPWVVGAAALGFAHTIRAVGTGVGPALNGRLGKASELLGGVAGCMAFTVAGLALFAWSDVAALRVAGLFLWGWGVGTNWVATVTAMQEEADGAVLGRLSATDQLTFGLLSSLAAIASGFWVSQSGSTHDSLVVGLVGGAVAWAALAGLQSYARRRSARHSV